jgi:hypothetical protein
MADPLVTGKVYVVRGMGYMLLAELPRPPGKSTVTMRAHGNVNYWAAVDDVVRLVDHEFVRVHTAQVRARGLDCTHPECWCRRVKAEAGV